MKNKIIAILVGAIIVFAYQAVSWMFSPIHANSFKYTPSEDAIITAINAGIQEEGVYMVPGKPPGMSHEEYEKLCMERAEKEMPWATVEYHKSMNMNMGKSAAMGFLTILLSVAIVVWMISKARVNLPGFMDVLLASVMFGAFVALYCHLSEMIWMYRAWHYIAGELIDAILAWALCGLWLAYWLRREPGKIDKTATTTV